ncbi:MAG TPA: serine/threonine-protein phosphatase, partial [Chloroflexi bacterium]|nr:serine/threonine-protein phosphatase [Chloroflexota bacterium]
NLYLPDLTRNENSASQLPINEVLNAAVIAANHAVLEQVPEAGTTLTIAVVTGHYAYLAHVGDSRAYLYHDGQLQQITQDHSLVARLVELGQATAEEALTHPQRNVLYRAIGQSGTLEVETYFQSLPVNAYLLICSDGLWGMVPDDEITHILASATTPEDGVDKLIDAANANGGDDNITAILVGIGE